MVSDVVSLRPVYNATEPLARFAMALFDLDDANSSVGYRNLRNASAGSMGAEIKEGLEELWRRYEPYADTNFSKEFAKQVEPRFWEMYLSVCLLASRRKL